MNKYKFHLGLLLICNIKKVKKTKQKKHYCCHAKPHPNMHCMCSAVNLVSMLSNSYTECSSAAIFHQYSLTLSWINTLINHKYIFFHVSFVSQIIQNIMLIKFFFKYFIWYFSCTSFFSWLKIHLLVDVVWKGIACLCRVYISITPEYYVILPSILALNCTFYHHFRSNI